ncbi:MAG: porin [Alphaproteobacteria bacterium]|nr:porin [Alphaproteobacteria bacterium]
MVREKKISRRRDACDTVSYQAILLAFAAVISFDQASAQEANTSAGQPTQMVAQARDTKVAEIAAIRAETANLKKENDALEARLYQLEKRQAERAKKQKEASNQTATGAPSDSFTALAASSASNLLTGDGPLTWHGITLYGSIQAGVAYLTHGAPFNGYAASSLPYLVSKYSNRPTFGYAGNDYGSSYLGLKGAEEILPGVSAIFNMTSFFDTGSGNLSDGLKSLVMQNGVPLANQSANSDTSLAGQLFNDQVYTGLSSPTYGTLTIGRQHALTADNMVKYDSMRTATGFSIYGYAGTYSAIGSTEDRRWDNSIKYGVDAGPLRFAAMAKPGDYSGANPAYQVGGGASYAGFSFDAYYGHFSDAIQSSSLSAAQLRTLPAGTLAGVVADTSGAQIGASYTWTQFVLMGGYEQIHFSNPANPLPANVTTIGGYTLSTVSNTAFPHNKILNASWLGLRYNYSKELELNAAYYGVTQNSYGTKSCSDASAITCSGWLQGYSFIADYHFTKRVDVYGGIFYTVYGNGLASGSLYKNNFMPQAGMRFIF